MTEAVINSQQSLDSFIESIRTQWNKHKYLRVSVKTGRQRTLSQNAALHKWLGMVADALNDAGYDFREFVKEGYPVPWTPELAKDHIWRPVQKAITGKDSTTKPETHQYGEIYDALNLKLAEYQIHVPWPCVETMGAA